LLFFKVRCRRRDRIHASFPEQSVIHIVLGIKNVLWVSGMQ
jgi:hypothetical protein